MKYGYFDDKNKAYVITNPLTPTPWINYLGTKGYYALISQTGGGYTFYEDAKLRRITRYRYNNVPTDFGGKYYYIKDGNQVWNPGFLPMKTNLDHYECHHGMGYTKIISSLNEISTELTYFIPTEDQVELHVMKIINNSQEQKNIKVFGLVEWALWNAVDDQTNFQRNLNIAEVEVIGNTVFHKTEYRERRNHYAYYHVNQDISGFDTDRESFLGLYRGWQDPLVVLEGRSNNSIASGGSPIASLENEISLAPGEEKTLIYHLGYIENEEDDKFDSTGFINKTKAYRNMDKYDDLEEVIHAFDILGTFWDNTLSKYQIQSDDEKLNRMVNIWHQYQCMTTFNMSRSASYYESGTGRGMGFRDSCQDILGFVHMIPERSRERILDLAAIQLEDGSTYHQYQPLTKEGNADIGGKFNDDPLWLIAAVSAYIKETGDASILDVKIPYNHVKGSEKPLFDHLKRSIHYTMKNLGPHQLPLIGRADWNDCLNLNCFSKTPGESFQTTEHIESGVAESVFIAGMFVKYGKEYIDLCHLIDEKNEANIVTKAVDQMTKSVLEHGWDGSWFLRAYDAFGNKVGSHENDEGKIFVEPQGFCTMAGIGGIEYGKKALSNVDRYLKNDYGVELLYPPYSKYHLELGEISSYPPGYKENGSVFCHNNPWIVIAYANVSDGDRAFDIYQRNAPAYNEHISEIHKTEPYVYAQTIAGRFASHYGEAKNSWLTGTASWTFVAISQYILGIKPHLEGLEIDPVLPHDINDLDIIRFFRNSQFNIHIRKNQDKQGQLYVDGKIQQSKIIKLTPHDKMYDVIIYV